MPLCSHLSILVWGTVALMKDFTLLTHDPGPVPAGPVAARSAMAPEPVGLAEPHRRSVPAAGRPPGPRPRVVDQTVLENGGVFVGRFKSKLGHYQDGRPERPPTHAAPPGKCGTLW